jgi:hypothetical protein
MEMTKCEKILLFLSGKKTTIGTILSFLNIYLFVEGIINKNLALLVQGILVALGLTANIKTPMIFDKLGKNKLLENINENNN